MSRGLERASWSCVLALLAALSACTSSESPTPLSLGSDDDATVVNAVIPDAADADAADIAVSDGPDTASCRAAPPPNFINNAPLVGAWFSEDCPYSRVVARAQGGTGTTMTIWFHGRPTTGRYTVIARGDPDAGDAWGTPPKGLPASPPGVVVDVTWFTEWTDIVSLVPNPPCTVDVNVSGDTVTVSFGPHLSKKEFETRGAFAANITVRMPPAGDACL